MKQDKTMEEFDELFYEEVNEMQGKWWRLRDDCGEEIKQFINENFIAKSEVEKLRKELIEYKKDKFYFEDNRINLDDVISKLNQLTKE